MCQRGATSPRKSTRSAIALWGASWVRNNISTKTTSPPRFVTTRNSGGTNGFVLGIISSLIGQHHRGNLGPYNDQICAGGPRLIHSETDDGPFLEDNMSRTSPTILITLVNAPHTPSVIPGFTAWEEVSGHVFHVCSLHERWDLLFMAVPLWSRQVSIKINGHQQHSTAVALPDGQYYVHNC